VNSYANAIVKQRTKLRRKTYLVNKMGLMERKIIPGVPEWSSPSGHLDNILFRPMF